MARDIIEMPAEEMVCPYCGKKVLMCWQLADYGYGETSSQFIGLRKLEQEQSYHRTIKSPPKPRPPTSISIVDIRKVVKKHPPKRKRGV